MSLCCVLLSPPAKEKDDHLAEPGEIDPVSRPPVDPQFQHAFARRLDISEVAGGNSCQPRFDSRTGLPVVQPRQPLNEWPLAGSSLIVTKLDHGQCNL